MFTGANQVKKCPTTSVCKICTYVQNKINQINDSFYLPSDSEHTFSASYFHEKPILDVSTIEYLIKEMNFHRVQEKELNDHHNDMNKR